MDNDALGIRVYSHQWFKINTVYCLLCAVHFKEQYIRIVPE